jgi:hypothetical protein
LEVYVTKGPRIILLFFAAMLAVSVPLFAHHGNAAYDYSKTVTLKGTVVDWFWANPHCLLRMDVKDDAGNVRQWTIEAGGPPAISPGGWSRTSFKPGDAITVDVMPVKNGGALGRFRKVTLADGTVLGGGSASAGPN